VLSVSSKKRELISDELQSCLLEGDVMSQFYPQSPQPPSYPPQGPPEDYYYEDDYDEYEYEDDEDGADNTVRYALFFVGGGCLVFLCMACCFLMAAGAWMLDSSLAATPVPGSDVGLTFDTAAYLNETVVNDQNVAMTVLRVDRNAALPTVPQVEGREVIIVTLELENLDADLDAQYSASDFLLLNNYEEAYVPVSGDNIIDGALVRGTLRPEEGLQGRLVFEVLAGEPLLVMAWETRDSSSRYVELR
jgi:hypothetical protein